MSGEPTPQTSDTAPSTASAVDADAEVADAGGLVAYIREHAKTVAALAEEVAESRKASTVAHRVAITAVAGLSVAMAAVVILVGVVVENISTTQCTNQVLDQLISAQTANSKAAADDRASQLRFLGTLSDPATTADVRAQAFRDYFAGLEAANRIRAPLPTRTCD